MNQNSIFFRLIFISLVSIFLFLSGCKTSSETSPTSKEQPSTSKTKKKSDQSTKELEDKTNTTDSEKVDNTDSKPCSNPYYPVNHESEHTYKISGGTQTTYVLNQSPKGNNAFTESRNFDSGTKLVINWKCTPEGLRHAEFINSISMPKGMGEMETLQSSGITLPKVWEKGKKFSSEYKIRTNLKVANISASAKGTVTIESEIIELEDNVSVQGGDYVAARIDSVIKINISMKGRKIPTGDIKMSNWYAPKIGLIKQKTKTRFGSPTVEYTGEK